MSEQICEKDKIHTSVEDGITHVRQQEGNIFTDPMWGDKYTANLRNVGMVIGYQAANPLISWRLDYDPIKGLHINFEDKTQAEKRAIYHKIQGVWLSKTPEDVMLDYWLGWTKKHSENIPTAVAQSFKNTYHTVVNLDGGGGDVAAGQNWLNMIKYALYGLGVIP